MLTTPYLKIKRTTRRLLIRPYRDGDYVAWSEALRGSLPKQSEFDPGPPPAAHLTRAAFKVRLRRYRVLAGRDELYKFGVFQKRSGEHLGSVDLFLYARKDLHWANLGYQIHNTHWGRGFAQEAAKAALRIGFEELGLHRIEASMQPGNRASRRVALGIGMRSEGVRREFLLIDGKWRDLAVFASIKAAV